MDWMFPHPALSRPGPDKFRSMGVMQNVSDKCTWEPVYSMDLKPPEDRL
jgi:hypothetical protein